MESTCVSFRLSPRYGLLTALEAYDWFLRMMQGHEEFEVETDRDEELPMPFLGAVNSAHVASDGPNGARRTP